MWEVKTYIFSLGGWHYIKTTWEVHARIPQKYEAWLLKQETISKVLESEFADYMSMRMFLKILSLLLRDGICFKELKDLLQGLFPLFSSIYRAWETSSNTDCRSLQKFCFTLFSVCSYYRRFPCFGLLVEIRKKY
jgi:hypothetical protein